MLPVPIHYTSLTLALGLFDHPEWWGAEYETEYVTPYEIEHEHQYEIECG